MSFKQSKEKFWRLVSKTKTCWLWLGPTWKGYGKLYSGRDAWPAHRFSMLIHGHELKKELVVDHLCRVRNCVNPKHLRVVDIRTNTLENSAGISAINAKKKKCIRGHLLSGKNLWVYSRASGKMERKCRECMRINSRKMYEKHGWKYRARAREKYAKQALSRVEEILK